MSSPPQLELTGRSAQGGAGVGLVLENLCLAMALISLFGCGRHPPPATVEGTLRMNGKPLDNCLITFLPEPGQTTKGSHSTGVTDRQGAYRVRFDDQQEGAAVGRHRVTVQDLSASTGVVRRDNGTVDADAKQNVPPPPVRRSRIPQPYMSPKDTPLRKEVRPGHQVIDLDLKCPRVSPAPSRMAVIGHEGRWHRPADATMRGGIPGIPDDRLTTAAVFR